MRLERLFESLTVKVQAFSECRVAGGWRLRLPALDWVTLHFVVEGTGSVRDSDRNRHPVRTHSLAVVPPGKVHLLESGDAPRAEVVVDRTERPRERLATHTAGPSGAAELVVVCGRVEAALGSRVGLFDQVTEILVLDFSDNSRMRGIFEALLAEQRTSGPGTQLMTSALMSECFVHVFRRLSDDRERTPGWLRVLDDPSVARVVEEILSHPERPYSVASLAALAGQSRSTFAERFRESLGQTPMAFVREMRLRRAAGLLRRRPRLSVQAVARRVGYSRSYFAQSFQDRFGTTPSAYRSAQPRSGAPGDGRPAGPQGDGK